MANKQRRGRCALNKCYQRAGLVSALSDGTRKLILLYGCGFLGFWLAWGSFWCFLLRRFAERFADGYRYSRYGTIQVRASIIRNTVSYGMIRANGFTVRYGTSFDMPTGSDIAPRQLTLKSDSSGTITSVMYALGTTFSAIRAFSIIPI